MGDVAVAYKKMTSFAFIDVVLLKTSDYHIVLSEGILAKKFYMISFNGLKITGWNR